MISFDYVIVGSGLTGLTIARILSDAGREVAVIERRPHLGGNVWDDLHPSGIRFGTYGPHYFRTNSRMIWQFVNRFSAFFPFEAQVLTSLNGTLYDWPLRNTTISELVGHDWVPSFAGTPANFEEACLALMPHSVYLLFVKGYTEKQWGMPATYLEASLAKRFEIRYNDDNRLSRYRYQGIPKHGYAALLTNILGDIPLFLNIDYLMHRRHIKARKKLVFTGSVDEYFDFCFGRLQYRAQHRSLTYFPLHATAQPRVQVNYPDPKDGPHIRTIEWKHLLSPRRAATCIGTIVTTETPFTPSSSYEYEYPVPNVANRQLYERYRELARQTSDVLICGRLGEYRYYDMDQAIGRAMMLARRSLLAG